VSIDKQILAVVNDIELRLPFRSSFSFGSFIYTTIVIGNVKSRATNGNYVFVQREMTFIKTIPLRYIFHKPQQQQKHKQSAFLLFQLLQHFLSEIFPPGVYGRAQPVGKWSGSNKKMEARMEFIVENHKSFTSAYF
jgi:hypothetical protein